MTYITKPRLHHPSLTRNKVGYTRRDYEGRISTLCAGCGHDSISAAIVQASGNLILSRTGSPSSPALAAVRRHLTIFLGPRTASIRCMVECHRSSPEPISPTVN